jgi:hypothetical protein
VPSYTVGYIDVYRNGVRLVSTDFTATTGTTVVLANACTVGDAVVTESFYVSSVLNAIPATAGSVSDSYIVSMAGSKLTGTQVIPKATLPTGSVLQVVQGTYGTATQIQSTTFTDTGLTASITPTSATSKILVIVSQPGFCSYSSGGNAIIPNLCRNGSEILRLGQSQSNTTTFAPFSINVTYLDSPATTSSTTYKTQVKWSAGASASNTIFLNWTSDIDGNSTMVLMEIAG